MKDEQKTKGQLIDELEEMRRRAAELEEAAADITERKRTEKALKAERDRLQNLMDGLADAGVGIDIVGADYRIHYQNSTLRERFGDVEERKCYKVYMELEEPCEFCPMREAIREARTARKELTGVDGKRYELRATPFPNPDGTIDKAIEIVQDITERKKAEEALRESEERYRTVVNSAMTGIYIRRGNTFLFANERAEKITGYTQKELLNMAPLDLVHPEDRERARQQMLDRESNDIPHAFFQYRIVTKDGSNRWIEQFGIPIIYEGERAILGQFVDFTGRKQAEEERQKLEAHLQYAQKLESIGTLAGGIAHDFNNLLTSILGNAELAVMHIPHFSPAINNLEEINASARRAADLCSQMLAYSGKGQFVVRAIDLTSLVREMSQLLEVSISRKASLKYEFSEDIPAIEADPSQIHQTIMNLVVNASEALGDAGGTITVATGAMQCDRDYLSNTYLGAELPQGTYAFVEVADTGCGMDDETLEKLFDPFFSTKFTGRGLGLAAVLGIVRGHRGAIVVHTEPEKGTTFRILFPRSEQAVQAKRDKDAEAVDWSGSGIVLFVDDEAAVLKIGTRMLETLGFDVLTAVDGVEAVELYRERKDDIALVLLDVTMPRMGGEEAFEEIKAIKDDAIILLSSGYEEQDVVNRFTDKGLAGFIHKPYEFETFKEMIRQALTG